jgi:hypothetical protein
MSTPASAYLLALGRCVLTPYTHLPGVACAAITGSSAEGLSDTNSDLDSTIYYDTLPAEADIRAVREQVGGGPLILSLGSYADGEFMESFRVNGVECQVGHTTVAQWEKEMTRILAGEDPGSPSHKAMSGTLISIPITGDDRLEAWKQRIRAYPDALRLSMVRHHLRFFALWGVLDRVLTRDANLWYRQSLLDASFNLLGVCAGLSRKYFTPFQFKRTSAFVSTLTIAPPRLAERLESLWHLPPDAAAAELRTLVAETTDLVERELPVIDTTACRKSLARNDRPWTQP